MDLINQDTDTDDSTDEYLMNKDKVRTIKVKRKLNKEKVCMKPVNDSEVNEICDEINDTCSIVEYLHQELSDSVQEIQNNDDKIIFSKGKRIEYMLELKPLKAMSDLKTTAYRRFFNMHVKRFHSLQTANIKSCGNGKFKPMQDKFMNLNTKINGATSTHSTEQMNHLRNEIVKCVEKVFPPKDIQ